MNEAEYRLVRPGRQSCARKKHGDGAAGLVRKGRLSRFSAYSPGVHWHRKTSRTCIEGPFGEVLRATGPMAKANPFRFSTKYQDDETDLLYYGYRYYSASTGRWNSRDLMAELGGENLYAFVRNACIVRWDLLGLLSAGSPTSHTSLIRHDNYLLFLLTCPRCSVVTNVRVDYSGAWQGLQALGLDEDMLTDAFGTAFNGPQDLGGLKSVKTPNCFGNAVKVEAYMRTRLSNQAYLTALHLEFFNTDGFPALRAPDPVGAYVKGTIVTYDCAPCVPTARIWPQDLPEPFPDR